jgi:hypothetical protein
MEDFIENVIRLARFFFSSLLGLIVTIIRPFISLFEKKDKTTRILFVSISFLFMIFLLTTLTRMLDV